MTTTIEWTDKTWNPVRGCRRVSPGCENCYAERVAHRFSGPGQPYAGLTVLGSKGPRWAGHAVTVPEKLDEPLRWRKPARVFVNSMSDLFHEDVPDSFIAAVFGVMASSPQHTFQVLTKRPERMRKWFARQVGPCEWDETREIMCDPIEDIIDAAGRALVGTQSGALERLADDEARFALLRWPLPNVWIGVSVEDQKRADERIPLLLETPAAVRFLSCEPLLRPVDPFTVIARWQDRTSHAERQHLPLGRPLLDWVIVGGESGPGARPFEVEWVRAIVRDCRYAGVACFVKQLGGRPYLAPHLIDGAAVLNPLRLASPKGGDPAEWPEDLRVREWPQEVTT